MFEPGKFQNRVSSICIFSDFEFVSDFELRASDFCASKSASQATRLNERAAPGLI
jgi:hypothetical protein